jgi:hypothetical protein
VHATRSNTKSVADAGHFGRGNGNIGRCANAKLPVRIFSPTPNRTAATNAQVKLQPVETTVALVIPETSTGTELRTVE